LNQNPDNASLYAKLKNIDASSVDASCSNPGFEAVAGSYLKVFDDVISAVEEKPGDVQPACDRLIAVGKMHRAKNPDNASLYAKLKNIDASSVDASCSNPGFEAVAGSYLKVFDDVISAVEEKPGDVQPACDRLIAVGKMHRAKVAHLYTTSQILVSN
uniref:GLOBIN domain-containing protein n=1 Tax=Heligmosomoides polygyrus TaxID=6339 RepID=A0A183FWI3_HELPZ